MKSNLCAMAMVRRAALLTALAWGGAAAAAEAAEADKFSLADTAGQHLDVLLGGKVVARYMDAYDVSTSQRKLETYKPYLHIFDAAGKAPITKGPGGTFTHHRGIFIGWNKISCNGKSYDRWHMKGGEQIHRQFLAQEADAEHAAFTSKVDWLGEPGQVLLAEERTMAFRPAAAPARLIVDFTTKLKAVAGDLVLDGDPEHAGCQYRPAAEVDGKQTVYVFPKEQADPKKDLDYPWAGETYTLAGQQHSAVIMSHPDNPKGTRWSAYRDYGRFGAFTKAPVKAGETLTLRYRFVIADGAMPPADAIQKIYNAFSGGTAATPPVTIRKADMAAAPKPKTMKK
jgi:hypothetical protein